MEGLHCFANLSCIFSNVRRADSLSIKNFSKIAVCIRHDDSIPKSGKIHHVGGIQVPGKIITIALDLTITLSEGELIEDRHYVGRLATLAEDVAALPFQLKTLPTPHEFDHHIPAAPIVDGVQLAKVGEYRLLHAALPEIRHVRGTIAGVDEQPLYLGHGLILAHPDLPREVREPVDLDRIPHDGVHAPAPVRVIVDVRVGVAQQRLDREVAVHGADVLRSEYHARFRRVDGGAVAVRHISAEEAKSGLHHEGASRRGAILDGDVRHGLRLRILGRRQKSDGLDGEGANNVRDHLGEVVVAAHPTPRQLGHFGELYSVFSSVKFLAVLYGFPFDGGS
mmetsp:Transcript_15225/g.36542  ORF Transcript_15225/g.36542 Transcript_15225/m.36542 type:complete len:337 (+) Transcript_15225:2918-3928(+)